MAKHVTSTRQDTGHRGAWTYCRDTGVACGWCSLSLTSNSPIVGTENAALDFRV